MPELTLIEAINSALHEEMGRDERVILLGEDIGRYEGVFRATEGLHAAFGDKRVIDTPLNESGIVGVSIGLALYGYIPVAEIQFLDFVYPAMDQIVSELAKIRYRTAGEYKSHVVIRAPYGGGTKGGPHHSQSCETFFTHVPGLKVVIPSNPYDAKGLLKSAIRDDDPVIFLEPKRLYRMHPGDVPDNDYVIPLGKARIAKEGEDVSIFTYGSMTRIVLEASEKAKQAGIDAEVVDLRTLVPLDVSTIVNSAKKTGRAVMVYEAPKTMGYGAEIAALIAEEAMDHLKAPIARVGGFDTPFPYAYENLYIPTVERILRAIKHVTSY
jgi:2-oxoisovalerate dehydrogenase E1 component beta subunit